MTKRVSSRFDLRCLDLPIQASSPDGCTRGRIECSIKENHSFSFVLIFIDQEENFSQNYVLYFRECFRSTEPQKPKKQLFILNSVACFANLASQVTTCDLIKKGMIYPREANHVMAT